MLSQQAEAQDSYSKPFFFLKKKRKWTPHFFSLHICVYISVICFTHYVEGHIGSSDF